MRSMVSSSTRANSTRLPSGVALNVAVVVVVSSPHRDDAFEAARFGIDTLKSSTPIWKREVTRPEIAAARV